VKPPHLGGRVCGPCPDFASYTLVFALQLSKITENFIQGSRKALGWSAPNAIRLVNFAIASERAFTRGDWVGTVINRLVILHSDWSSWSRDSSVALHWFFLPWLSRRFTDLCSRWPQPWWPATASAAGSSGLSNPECQPLSGAAGRHAGYTWK